MNLFFHLNHSLIKETFVYTATDMVGKAMSFVLLPIVSFYMPPEELGIATNFTVLTNLIILLAGLAVVNSLPYFFYEQEKDENNLLVSNLLILCTALCAFLSGLILTFQQQVENYLQLSLKTQLLSIFFVYGSLISQTNLVLLRLENKANHFACLQLFQILFHALMVILFVIVFKGGGLGKIYAEVLVFSLMGIVHFFILYNKGYLKLKLELMWIKKLLKFGIPLMPHSVSFWFKGGMDKVFITNYCGLHFNGLYSMALSISSLYTMLVNAFFNAYTPYVQKMLATTKEEELLEVKYKIVKQTYWLCLVFCLIGIIAIVGSWIIITFLIDNKYEPAFGYVPLIIFANFIYTFYNFTIQFIYKVKKTLIMGIITFSGSIIQMLLSYLLIKRFGVTGALYSLLIGNIIITLGISIYSNIVYPMPWMHKKR